MSRIGKKPITLPKGVTVKVHPDAVEVQGPKGKLKQAFPAGIKFEQADGTLLAKCVSEDPELGKFHGLARSLIANAVAGVTDGFKKELDIIGVGYRAAAQGPTTLDLALGFSHPVKIEAPDGITFEVPAPNRIAVKGSDKELVGQVAADIRKLRKPEPYKGKGVRYLGEHVARKAGKAGK